MRCATDFRTLFVLLLTALLFTPSCRRATEITAAKHSDVAAAPMRDVFCLEQADGCLYCVGRDGYPPFLEADQSRPRACDPKGSEDCVEFCSALVPTCALPWDTGTHCLLDSELTFHRAVFNRDTMDRPEVVLNGRVIDEAGHRLEGVRVESWVARGSGWTPLGEELSGKDGGFRIRLRSGPWTYAIRLRRTGLASDIIDKLSPDKLGTTLGTVRLFRMGPESTARGRVVDAASGAPIAGAVIQAVRAPEETIDVNETKTADDGSFVLGGLEARRYTLRISKFGWRPLVMKNAINAPATRVLAKLVRATVIRGVVKDAEGQPEANATVAAVLSDVPGAPTLPIFWTTDAQGRFAEDHFSPGTYYLWARRGDMLVYPPEKIELAEDADVEVDLHLTHKGARVTGQVTPRAGYTLSSNARAVLLSRAPSLAFPRPGVGALDAQGNFSIGGVLPGRYDLSIRDGGKVLTIVAGPRDVEVPIDPDTTVPLKEALLVRPQLAE